MQYEKEHEIQNINTDESTHSKTGPVTQNPIQRTVRTKCAYNRIRKKRRSLRFIAMRRMSHDDIPDERQPTVVHQHYGARYSFTLEDSEDLPRRHVPQGRRRAGSADQDPPTVDRQRHGNVGRRRAEIFQRSRQLLSRSDVHQSLLSAENVSGQENATLRRNPVAERVQPIAGRKVVDVCWTSDGIALDYEESAVRGRKHPRPSSRPQIAYVEGPTAFAAVGEVPAGDRAVSGDGNQLIASSAKRDIAHDSRVAFQNVQTQCSRRVETLEDRKQSAVSSRWRSTVALL